MVSLSGLAVTAGAGTGLILAVLMLWSYLRPEERFWPPGERDVRWAVYWILALAWTGSFLVTGVYGETILPGDVLRHAGGVLMLAVGIIGSVVSISQLGRERTEGVETSLKTDGLYRYSRNPQVVANIVTIVGYLLVMGTTAVVAVGVTGVIWLLLMPFAEEPWLEDEFGEEYVQYREDVPRYL